MSQHPYDRVPTEQVRVKDLRVGDVLWPTGRTVTHAACDGVRVPPRKRRVGIDGYWRVWGSETVVSIERRQCIRPRYDVDPYTERGLLCDDDHCRCGRCV